MMRVVEMDTAQVKADSALNSGERLEVKSFVFCKE